MWELTRLVSKQDDSSRRRRLGTGAFIAALLLAWIIAPGMVLYHQAMIAKHDVRALAAANKAHNFADLAQSLNQLNQQMDSISRTLGWMRYWAWVPGVGSKYRDGQAALAAVQQGLGGVLMMMPALSRMAPLLGYSTAAHPRARRSGQKKVEAFVSALPILGPDLKRAYPDFARAAQRLDQVNPQDFRGFLAPLGQKLNTAKSLLDTAVKNMPLIYQSSAVLQNILGDPTAKRYLLIFQNSGELRATGGFMTAYGYVTLDQGKLGRIRAQNMYLLDAQVTYHAPASPVIANDLPVYYWHLRDANTSPDVPTTVSYIKQFYDSIPNAPKVDGVIFVDTWFVDRLIGDVGGLTVPTPKGPVHLTEADANIKMEDMAEGQGLPDNVRKKFIGTMMKALFHEVMNSHGQELARVLRTVNLSLNRKFIVLNFNNPQAEALVRRYHWGGVMDRYVAGDYLSVVDENLLGHKDNYRMSYHLVTKLTKVGSRYRQTTSMSWRDPAVDNGWLFVPYRSWVRFYVPLGSQLISISGVDGIPYEDYVNTTVNKTVFGGHVNLPDRTSNSQPIATHTVTVTYWLPAGLSPTELTVQLQPGVNHQRLTVIRGSFRKTVPFTHDLVFHWANR